MYEIFRIGADDDDQEFTTEMSGALEAPGPGDPDGSSMANITVNLFKRQVCFAPMVSDIGPATAAHIHVGVPAVAGPVVVPLNPAPSDGSSRNVRIM